MAIRFEAKRVSGAGAARLEHCILTRDGGNACFMPVGAGHSQAVTPRNLNRSVPKSY